MHLLLLPVQTVCKALAPIGTLHPLPTLQNNEPVPQVLKQAVNLSCLTGKTFTTEVDFLQ